MKSIVQQMIGVKVKSNQTQIDYQMQKIEKGMEYLSALLQKNDWIGASIWTDGHMAEDVSRMGSLLRERQTLLQLQEIKEDEV